VDFSKLPKLSETKPEPPPEQPPPNTTPITQRHLLVGAEIWICFGLGAILILLSSQPIEYLFTLNHPERFSSAVSDANGNPISYPSSVFFLPQLGVCVFGFILILDGLQMLVARSLLFAEFTFGVTIAGTILNIVAAISAYRNNVGYLACLLAIIFGGYTAMSQWNVIRGLRRFRRFQTDR
jgi:hypothetical protein